MDFTGFLGNDAIKRRLSGAFASGRVAHSYLLCGPAGSGKHTLARILCAAMECEKDGAAVPCGVCPGCRKALAGIHPDVITVDDPDHKAMTVDPIRAARSDMFIRPNEGRRKIYVIPRGQDMNERAAGLRRVPDPLDQCRTAAADHPQPLRGAAARPRGRADGAAVSAAAGT